MVLLRLSQPLWCWKSEAYHHCVGSKRSIISGTFAVWSAISCNSKDRISLLWNDGPHGCISHFLAIMVLRMHDSVLFLAICFYSPRSFDWIVILYWIGFLQVFWFVIYLSLIQLIISQFHYSSFCVILTWIELTKIVTLLLWPYNFFKNFDSVCHKKEIKLIRGLKS